MVKLAKIENLKCDILCDFQTLWSGQKWSKNPLGYDKRLDDDFYLHPQEVESRIINLGLAFAVFFSFYALIMLCILGYLRLSSKDPIVILPEINIDTQIGRGRPIMHLALIYEDGSVYDQYLPYSLPSNKTLNVLSWVSRL